MQKVKSDVLMVLGVLALFAPFALIPDVLDFYKQFNLSNPVVMSYLKFAVLATLGEAIGARIKTGRYPNKSFGLLPRAVVWGLLGITIYMAFVVFAKGVPLLLEELGYVGATEVLKGGVSVQKVAVAASISVGMNLVYAPVMMTLHRITDMHILAGGGRLSSLLKPIPFVRILQTMDWTTQWRFVFCKTIPLFWIPAHTVTFLLPPAYRVLFAALLGIVLGVLLAVAGKRSNEEAGKVASLG